LTNRLRNANENHGRKDRVKTQSSGEPKPGKVANKDYDWDVKARKGS